MDRTQTLPSTNAQAKTPPSIGSHMNFPTNEKLDKYSQSAAKKIGGKIIGGNERKEREARKMVIDNSNETHLEVAMECSLGRVN